MLKQHRTSTAFALKIQFISYGTLALLTVLPSAAALADTTTSKVSYEYDPTTGLVNTKTTNPDDAQLSVKTTYAYNIDGNVLTKTVSSTATGLAAIPTRTTEKITYDTNRTTPISFTNAIGQVTTVQMNTSNLPTYIQNLNGLKTTRTYLRGQVTTETRPDQSSTIWQYYKCDIRCVANEAYFIQAKVLGSDGLQSSPITTTYFDSLQREVRKETQGFDGTSIIVQNTEYDNLGRVYRKSRPYYKGQSVKWTTMSYDELGRVVDVTGADGSVVHTAYDGYRTTVTNPLGQVRTQISNSRGQTVQVIDTMGSVLRYEYDAQGNLLKTIDPNGNTVSMSYNPLGQKIGMVDPDMGAFSYVYDVLGQLKQQTDSKNQVTTLNYDLLGRLINRTEPDLKSDWTYDSCTMGKGLLCKVTSDNGYSKAQSYDTVSRPSVTTTTIDTAYASTITYDAGGRIATQSYPTGLTVKYIYTTLGYLKEVRNNATNALYWQANAMDAEGHLTQQTYGNNIVTQQVFDPATGRVKNVYAGAGNAVQNLSYTYDTRGNMLSRNDANQNLAETFLYDPLNRVTSNTVNSSGAGVVTQNYTYDAIGNISTRSDVGAYTYGVVNARPHAVVEIVHADGGKRQYGYDAIGNLTQEIELDPTGAVIVTKGRTETYTSFNMPISLAKPGTTLSFVYGADHQRIKQIMPSGTTIYVHPDNAGALSYEKELKSDGTVEHKHFITAGDGVIAVIKQVGTTLTPIYFHRDNLGSTTAVSNAAGAVIERLAYEPFGKRRTPAGSLDANGALIGITTDRGYTNHEELDELGLVHMNGRIYDPTIGRFATSDPSVPIATDIQSYNRYSYTRNNPLTAIDPNGFTDVPEYCFHYLYWGCPGYQEVQQARSDRDAGRPSSLANLAGSFGTYSLPDAPASRPRGVVTVGAVQEVQPGGANSPITFESITAPALVSNPAVPGCKGPCIPAEKGIDWMGAGKATIGMLGNAGGIFAGAVMSGAPTGITQVLGGYLIADGAYGFGASAVDFSAAMNWTKSGTPENINSLPRLAATVVFPNNTGAQRTADVVSLTTGLAGGRSVVQPLMFSTRQIYATSNWSPAAQMGMSAYSVLQAWDASVPAAQTIQGKP